MMMVNCRIDCSNILELSMLEMPLVCASFLVLLMLSSLLDGVFFWEPPISQFSLIILIFLLLHWLFPKTPPKLNRNSDTSPLIC